jgi:hypothetical protein
MEITEITRYEFDGKEYKTLQAIKTEIENRLGVIIDKCDIPLSSKQRLSILKVFITNKESLEYLLGITFTVETSEYSEVTKNILDL